MGITTTQYIKKPLYVDAVRITRKNFDEVVAWCKGRVRTDRDGLHENSGKRFIKLQTHNPINTRQTKAYVGDWILKTNRGFKIYTHTAFLESFDEVLAPKDRSVEAQVTEFDDEDTDSCASPRARFDPGVPQ